jgi:WhiB family redox-sensing transcriptional regulator
MADVSRLPGPVGDSWLWQQKGSCLQADSRIFFHPEGERGPARQRRESAAVSVCSACPVIKDCRRHALAVREPYGVWGGLTTEQRDALIRTNDTSRTDPGETRRQPGKYNLTTGGTPRH